MQNDKYSSDSPVHTASEDRFSRWVFAERVAEVISGRKDPSSITIGLYGAWGDGKTSVLNFIEESIKTKSSVIVVRFNPWLYGSIELLLIGFFNVLAEALDTDLITKGDKFKDILKKIVPGIASVAGLKGLGDSVSAFLHGPDIKQLRIRIEKELETAQKRILIIVDDVDRLEKAEIHVIFKLVKLVADFKYTAYLLAFDKEIVAASLSENYSGANEKSGDHFLEKIIQVPLHLPSVPEKDLRQFCFQGVDEALNVSEISLSEHQSQEFAMNFTRAFNDRLTTPRKAKLYGNILMFSLPILKGEVNPVDLMLIEGMRVFIPELYEVIRKNKDSFIGLFRESKYYDSEPEKSRVKGIIEAALTRAGVKEPSGYTELLKNMFPKLQSVYGNIHYESDWYQKWNEGQRVCAEGYFDRYFTYSVPKGDFADTAINFLIQEIDEVGNNISSENNPLMAVLTADNAGTLIQKLRNKANILNNVQSAYLSIAVSLLATKYPIVESMIGWDDPHTQAAMLVSDLVQNLDKDKRVAHVIKCLKHSTSPAFQFEIFRWLRKEEADKPERDAFNKKEEDEIGEVLAMSLETYIQSIDDITTEAEQIAPQIFFILNRYHRKNAITAHVERVLDRDKSAVIRLLDLYTRTAWEMESGISHKSDFEKDQYDSVTVIFDPSFIWASIEAYLNGLPDDQKNYPRDYEHKDRSIIMHQFVWIHRRVLKEKSEEKIVTNTN